VAVSVRQVEPAERIDMRQREAEGAGQVKREIPRPTDYFRIEPPAANAV
jgi:hypothetical protein